MAIKSFARREVEDFFFTGKRPRREGWAALAKVVARKLDMVHYAQSIDDLRSPPGNRLEALKGRLAGFYSIRINDQWRIVFRWSGDEPEALDVTDYHR